MTLNQAKKDSYKIFDSIASRYDLINEVLSLGLHSNWRRVLRTRLLKDIDAPIKVLDLATGTGDVALALAESEKVLSVTGIDLSEGMLAMGRLKAVKKALSHKVKLEFGDAMAIGLKGFDAATMAFGIRNVSDPLLCLKGIHNALKPRGVIFILEFSLPSWRWFRRLHLWYLRRVLPHIGKFLSGHSFAYRYLNETIESFPHGESFTGLMTEAGFKSCTFQPLSLGIVNLYRGEKP